jgi:outer membrane protein assembly factor BamE
MHISVYHVLLRAKQHTKCLIISAVFFALPACSIHQIDIQQGNVITKKMTDKLKIGMDMNQVRYVMGTPLIVDPFHKNRWDYVYSLDTHNGKKQTSHITVLFENERVIRYVGIPSEAQKVALKNTSETTSE